jgi:protease YdgD
VPLIARTVAWLLDEGWERERFSSSNDIDGTDWALLRLDTSLGDTLGYLGTADLATTGAAREVEIFQAGFSWDTGDNLSGNEACSVVHLYGDGTMAHECDTTRGDSGSPFLIREGEDWAVIATDSNFRNQEKGPHAYIAALSPAWMDQVEDFAAGRIGIEPPPVDMRKPAMAMKGARTP